MVPWWWPFGRVPDVEPRALDSALRGERAPQLLDVRTRGEFERGRVRGARFVPVHRFRGALPSLGLDAGRPVVAICKTGHRSRGAVRLLQRLGHDAHNLAGGMDAWRRAGLDEERG